jgi:hypothetical protein
VTELKPAADEEPVGMTLEEARAILDAHPEALGVYDSPAGPVLSLPSFSYLEPTPREPPVTPPRPLRVRVDTGPVGYLWLEWLGACARVAGIAS